MDDIGGPLLAGVCGPEKAKRPSRGNSWEFGYLFTYSLPHLILYPFLPLTHYTLVLGRPHAEDSDDSDELPVCASSQSDRGNRPLPDSDNPVSLWHINGGYFAVFCHGVG